MYGKPEITKTKIKCEECGVWFKKINGSHLKKHKLALSEYKKKWGFKKKQPLESLSLKELRKKYNKNYGSVENLFKWAKENPEEHQKHLIKKGQTKRRERSEQEIIELTKRVMGVMRGPEARKKLSKTMKKKWQDPNYRQRVINGLKNLDKKK